MSAFRQWRRRKQTNRAHARALACYCTTDGQRHQWEYDYSLPPNPRAPSYPGYCTPFGDIQVCQRGCGAQRLVNVPDR